jgi:hypothetical protein
MLALLVFVLMLLVLGWWLEVRTPRWVHWRAVDHQGIAAHVAPDLVLQHDDGSSVWASFGYSIYRSDPGRGFRRIARVRPPFGEPWAGYLRSLRRIFGYQELLEVWPLDARRLLVFAGQWVHLLDLRTGRARRVQRLRWSGRGKGRGLMAFGLDRAADDTLYFGEYVTASGDRSIGLWRSRDAGERWELAFEFESGQVRHIHAVHCDLDGSVWIGTGDRDEHCFVGRSLDGGSTFEWVGHGTQIHRACAFVSFDDALLWSTDADFEQNHVVRWDRTTGDTAVGAELPDVTYYAMRLDGERALLGLAQGVAQVWVAHRDGRADPWLDWSVRVPARRGPPPGVRLARGGVCDGEYVHVNPLRTITHEAAIFRFARTDLPA